MPGGHGARIRHVHPSHIDDLAADFPNLKILMAHPGWPWVEETTAVAQHKGNVYWEMSGWAPKHFPGHLKVDIRGRLQDKIMFDSDYPSLPYERILREWRDGLQGRGDGEGDAWECGEGVGVVGNGRWAAVCGPGSRRAGKAAGAEVRIRP